MSEYNSIIGEKLSEKIEKDNEVIAIILFGSYLKKGNYGDIDICLVLSNKLDNLYLSRKRLNYLSVSKDKADIQIFQQLPLYLRIEILREGKILLCKDMPRLYEIALDAIKEFRDFELKYKDYINRNHLKIFCSTQKESVGNHIID